MGPGLHVEPIFQSQLATLVYTPMTAKDPFDLFIQQVEKREKEKQHQQERASERAEEKSRKLIPVRKLLKKIQDTGLMVYHSERYTDRNTVSPPQRFTVFEDASSPSFQPGPSLYFDHPAQVEIAIPNDWDAEVMGVVCIRCSSSHPESGLFNGPFRSMDDALSALAEFLARSAVSMDSHPTGD